MALFTLWKSSKEEDKTTLIGQSTDKNLLIDTAKKHARNDGSFAVSNQGETITTKENIFDIFDKNDVMSNFSKED